MPVVARPAASGPEELGAHQVQHQVQHRVPSPGGGHDSDVLADFEAAIAPAID